MNSPISSKPFLPHRWLSTARRVRRRSRVGWAVAAVAAWASLGWPAQVQALAFAGSQVEFENLVVTPARGAFSVVAPWTAIGFAEASNSLGELDVDFDGADDGPASTAAIVTWADASGEAHGAALIAAATAIVDIPGSPSSQGSATGQGTLQTTFWITDSLNIPVDVTFSLDLFTDLSVLTDAQGLLADAVASLSLEVGGQTVIFHQDLLSIGSSASDATGFDGPLSNSLLLMPNTPYLLVLKVDSDARAITVPDAGRLPVGLALLSLMAAHARWCSRRSELGGSVLSTTA